MVKHTSIFNSKKDKQNAPKIPVTGHLKLTFCPISGMVFEILSLYPTEIWQPWCANFGNPEIKNVDL